MSQKKALPKAKQTREKSVFAKVTSLTTATSYKQTFKLLPSCQLSQSYHQVFANFNTSNKITAFEKHLHRPESHRSSLLGRNYSVTDKAPQSLGPIIKADCAGNSSTGGWNVEIMTADVLIFELLHSLEISFAEWVRPLFIRKSTFFNGNFCCLDRIRWWQRWWPLLTGKHCRQVEKVNCHNRTPPNNRDCPPPELPERGRGCEN